MDISDNTLRAYLMQFADGGVDALKIVPFQGTVSELDDWSSTLKAHFREHPAGSAIQARAEIIRLTGVERCPTQVRQFMNRLGMKFRKVAAVPAKTNADEQQAFKKKSWSLGWHKPRPAIGRSTL
jgi:transposase